MATALDELKNKEFKNRDHIEQTIIKLWEDTSGYEWLAEKAAEELAALRARVAEADEILLSLAHSDSDERNVLIGEAKDYVKRYEVTA